MARADDGKGEDALYADLDALQAKVTTLKNLFQYGVVQGSRVSCPQRIRV